MTTSAMTTENANPTTATSATSAVAEQTMRAMAQDRYGSPDQLRPVEMARPEIGADGVLVRVRATSVNALDWHMLRGHPYVLRLSDGLRVPKQRIRGVDVAGVVEAVGSAVTEFRPGDEVFGVRSGAMAEYVAGTEKRFAPKPAGLSFEEAAALPVAGITALQGLRDQGQVQPGQSVLVYGAGGGVGTFAVQIAKALGAVVTAVSSARNLGLLSSLGADRVIDYADEDFTRGPERYDVILDLGGNRSFGDLRRTLTADGTLVVCGAGAGKWVGPLKRPLAGVLRARLRGQRIRVYLADETKADMLVLKELVEAGSLRPVVERTYPLAEAAEALRRIESGQIQGKVVVTI